MRTHVIQGEDEAKLMHSYGHIKLQLACAIVRLSLPYTAVTSLLLPGTLTADAGHLPVEAEPPEHEQMGDTLAELAEDV
jgi:hypothetical protein